MATATTDANGVATMTTKIIPGAYAIKADGYTVTGTTSAADTEVSATATPMTYPEFENGMSFTATLKDDATYYQATNNGYITFANDYYPLTIEKNGTVMITSDAWMGLTIDVNAGDIIRVWTTGDIYPSMATVTVSVS